MTACPLKREEWWVWGMALKATSSNFCPTEINLRATFVVRSLAGNAGVWDQWSVWPSSFVQGLPLLVEFPMAHSIILLASHLSLSEVLTQLFTSCCILEYMQEQRSPVVYWDRVYWWCAWVYNAHVLLYRCHRKHTDNEVYWGQELSLLSIKADLKPI